MKIAHINNISGIGTTLAQEQQRLGHQVDVFVFNKKTHSQFGGIKINYHWPFSQKKFFKKLDEYDIWHYHYPYGSLKKKLERKITLTKYLKHYHGADLRKNPDDDFCLVSTPDLLQFAPRGRWLPSPIDLHEIEQIKNNGSKNNLVTIAHYPYYKNYHSEDNHSKVLKDLQNEGKCKVVNILNQTHNQTLQTIMGCDIVIGKIMQDVGWFGLFELEGMALGKPVIAYIDADLYKKYKPPVYLTNKENFKQDLSGLMEDEQERRRLSGMGIRYVEQNHSVKQVVKTLNEIYNSMKNN